MENARNERILETLQEREKAIKVQLQRVQNEIFETRQLISCSKLNSEHGLSRNSKLVTLIEADGNKPGTMMEIVYVFINNNNEFYFDLRKVGRLGIVGGFTIDEVLAMRQRYLDGEFESR